MPFLLTDIRNEKPWMLGTEMMAFVAERMVPERKKVLKICKPSATTLGLRRLSAAPSALRR